MFASQLMQVLPVLIAGGETILLTGPVGVGKTALAKWVADYLKRDLMITHPVVSDPTDFKGMPAVVSGKATWLPYGDLERMVTTKKHLIVFIDDLGQSTQAVQAAVMQLVLERQINGQKISDKVVFIAATNRRTDKAGVKGIITPLLSRFSTIIPFEVSTDDWIEWAYANEMPAELIAFIQFRPELLHKFDPKHVDSSGDSLVNQPCPRTVAACGRVMNLGIRDYEVLKGSVGEGFATELTAFLARIDKIGDLPRQIVNGKMPDCPEDSSTIFALSACLAKLVEKNGFAVIGKWVSEKMPEEFAARFLKDAEQLHGEVVTGAAGYVELSIKIDGFVAQG